MGSKKQALHLDNNVREEKNLMAKTMKGLLVGAASLTLASFTVFGSPAVTFADEYGKEVEAPTVFTGETAMICTKRGPLGACLKTSKRTVDNDNDKSDAYFRDPAESLKQKYSAQLAADESSTESNDLIQKLKQKTEDNKDRNALIVKQKTLQNDLGASFGPLDSQVVIMNANGETYTLLKGAQAMRLKDAGYIKDRRFVVQPSKEVIDKALQSEGGIGDVFKGLLGGDNTAD